MDISCVLSARKSVEYAKMISFKHLITLSFLVDSAAGARDERARTENLVETSRDDLGDYLIDINFLAIVSY